MKEILEMCMVLLFGVAWPASIAKSLRAKTAKGKSIMFLFVVFVGYLCGVASKLVSGSVNYVIFFYILNSIMVLTDIILYFRNSMIDKRNENKNANV
ncbi:MAG: hypothetical protein R2876_03970 [Eubacteriales bacterium]